MQPRLPTFLLGIFLLIASAPAFAWSEFGHQLVGELAERQLSETARAQIADLLRDAPEQSLASIAAWPDKARDLPEYEYTETFHYVNIDDDACRYDAARDCRKGNCIVAAIDRYTAELRDTTLPREQRAQALKFVVHFVGDVHQPLHAGNRPDKGGNDFQVNLDGEGTNLHSVWDRRILRSANLDLQTYADRLDAQRQRAPGLADGDAPAWAMESCSALAAQAIYPAKPGKLDPAYLVDKRSYVEQRIVQASERLAATLERALGATAGM